MVNLSRKHTTLRHIGLNILFSSLPLGLSISCCPEDLNNIVSLHL